MSITFVTLFPTYNVVAWSRVDPRTVDLNIYGPKGLRSIVEGLYNIFGESQFCREHYKIHLHELEEGPLVIGEHSFDYVSLPGADNHGLRCNLGNRRFGLTGDAFEIEPLIAFAKNCDTLIMDAGHPLDEEIIEVAVRAQTPKIVCTHIYRKLDLESLNAQAKKQGYTGELVLASDLMQFSL